MCSLTDLVRRCFLAREGGRVYRQEYQEEVWGEQVWGEGETKPCLGRSGIMEGRVLVKEQGINWKSAELQVNNNETNKLLKDIDEALKTGSAGVENDGVIPEGKNVFCIYDSESDSNSESENSIS